MLGEFLAREVTVDDQVHRYRVYAPPGLGSQAPSILFLHGRGESGADNEAQLSIGLSVAIRKAPERWPFVAIFPQKPGFDELWPDYRDVLNAQLKAVEQEFSLDPGRHYLTGLSQGGNGTFVLATALAWRFAAIAPICGWGEPRAVARDTAEIPAWIFHGEGDEVIPPSCSIAIADFRALCGAETKLTLFPDADHNSWDAAYAEPLGEWFLSRP